MANTIYAQDYLMANGEKFPIWEKTPKLTKIYYVDAESSKADDKGPGTKEKPFKTINKAAQVLEPGERYLGYIRVKGITFEHAANVFPVPQRGLVSTNRGHHWIVEDNTLLWANGISLDVGKEDWGAIDPEFPGFHVIRNNTIRYAGICAICGPTVENPIIEKILLNGSDGRMHNVQVSLPVLNIIAVEDRIIHQQGGTAMQNSVRDNITFESESQPKKLPGPFMNLLKGYVNINIDPRIFKE